MLPQQQQQQQIPPLQSPYVLQAQQQQERFPDVGQAPQPSRAPNQSVPPSFPTGYGTNLRY